jgi:peptidoglycan/xylan/chitin deacetylase (PgdA/CDA1 family)
MKRALLGIARRGGLFTPWRIANRGKLLILTYHRFSTTSDRRSVSAQVFDEHLAYLKKHYTPLPLSRVAELLAKQLPLPAFAAAITIDDGFSDSYEIAYPILRKHGLPATLFVVTNFLDGKTWLWTDKVRYLVGSARSGSAEMDFGAHRLTIELNGPASRLHEAERINLILKTLPDGLKEAAVNQIASTLGLVVPGLPPKDCAPVTWEQVREMSEGGIEIGSHTVNHPILTNTSDDQLSQEIVGSRKRLEEVLSEPIKLFCYPNGNFDQRVRRAVVQAGYECAVTTELGLNPTSRDIFSLRRVPAELDMDHFVQTTSGFEEVKERLR